MMKSIVNNCYLLMLLALNYFSCRQPATQQNPTISTDSSKGSQSQQVQYLSNQIKNNPANATLYLARSNEYLLLNDTLSAMSDLYTAMRLDSTKPEYYEKAAELHLGKRDLATALQILDKCLSINPAAASAHIRKGRYLFYNQDYQKAMSHLNAATKLDIFNAEVYFWKGMCYKEMDDTGKSISSFQTAVEQDADDYDSYMQLGLLMSTKKDIAALSYFDNAIRIDSSSTEAYYGKALFYQDNMSYAKAIETYKQIIQIDPQYEQAFYNIGFVYFHWDSLELARKNFDRAIKLAPTYTEAYYMKGHCSELMGDKQNAKADFTQAIRLRPRFELAQEGLKRVEK